MDAWSGGVEFWRGGGSGRIHFRFRQGEGEVVLQWETAGTLGTVGGLFTKEITRVKHMGGIRVTGAGRPWSLHRGGGAIQRALEIPEG